MPRPRKQDPETLRAALIGLQHMQDQVEQKIAELRSRIGVRGASAPRSASAAPVAPAPGKRVMSAAGRRRIALAQKKRWAAYKAEHAAKAKPKAQKRVLSAAGRARIAAATKKRWAEYRRAHQAPKAAPAKKAVKKAAVKKAPATKTAPAPAPAAAAPAAE